MTEQDELNLARLEYQQAEVIHRYKLQETEEALNKLTAARVRYFALRDQQKILLVEQAPNIIQ